MPRALKRIILLACLAVLSSTVSLSFAHAAVEGLASIEASRQAETGPVATWGLDRVDQRNLPLNSTYSYNRTGLGVHVYVVDSGINAIHNEFRDTRYTEFRTRISQGYTAINDGNGTNDCNGHGTHVAGIIGGVTYGVAKNVTLHPVRVSPCAGVWTPAALIAGLDWVTSNRIRPAVANLSLTSRELVEAPGVDAAIQRVINAGVTVVIAAGNENKNACNYAPSSTRAAIIVGATTASDRRWLNPEGRGSNFGLCLDLFAPGHDIPSAYWRTNTEWTKLSGTSMAAPHVSGTAALYLEVNPNASPTTVANTILSRATSNKVTNVDGSFNLENSPNKLLYSLVTTGVCEGAASTIEGTGGDDTIIGTEGSDVIMAYGGNDTIDGRGGNDRICGHEGDDTLSGGYGIDVIYGGGGNDTIYGNQGNDTLYGRVGNDTIYGGQDNDTLDGGENNDILDGNLGYDTANGQGGTDSCSAEVISNCP